MSSLLVSRSRRASWGAVCAWHLSVCAAVSLGWLWGGRSEGGGPLRCAPVRRDSRRAAAARVLSIVVRVVEVGEEAVCLWRAAVSLELFWAIFRDPEVRRQRG